jgi:superfamily II helicase
LIGAYFRDINENVVASRNWQLGKKVDYCNECNRPLNEHNGVYYAVHNDHIVASRGEKICVVCVNVRIERLSSQPAATL